jgi:hypothetical protein
MQNKAFPTKLFLAVKSFKVIAYTTLRVKYVLEGIGRFFKTTLLHLPPLRFHCVEGCWD